VTLSLPPGGLEPPRRMLTRAEFDAMLEQFREARESGTLGELLAGMPCPCGMVEVDNPVRREVRHRRGCERGGA
jgi:hypothetical protein